MDNNNFFVKLLNFNMFDRVGKQIKGLATDIASTILALFMIASIACIVVPFFVINDMHLGWFLLALLAALVVFGIGYLIAWFSGLFMYGYGELIDSASSINEKLGNGAKTPEVSENAKQETAVKASSAVREEKKPSEQSAPKPAAAPAAPAMPKPAAAPVNPSVSKPVESSLAKDLAFALRYRTNDGMIECLKRSKDPKVQEILEGPMDTVRERVQALLESLQ